MKIIIAVQDINLFNEFYDLAKDSNIELINGKIENKLFDIIANSKIDALVIQSDLSFTQRAIDYFKKRFPYIPTIIFVSKNKYVENGDISMPFCIEADTKLIYQITLENIKNYKRNFKKLKELFTKIEKPVNFGPCIYDPILRTITHNKNILKISPKMGGLIQILGMNYGKVVNKDIILEAVWEKSGDYFASRSMDVYITNLRKLLKEHNIPLEIKNIQGRGLIIK